MTKAELIEAVAKTNKNLSKKAVAEIMDATFDTMAKTLKREGRITYPGFGTFSVRKRKARTGRNPQTGETIKIKASRTVGFKPAPALKARI